MKFIGISRRLRSKINFVLPFFPELASEPIEFSLTDSLVKSQSTDIACAGYCSRTGVHFVRFSRAVRSHRLNTISHELCHVVSYIQYLNGDMDIALGERAIDLCALARGAILCDDLPAYFDTYVDRSVFIRNRTAISDILHSIAKKSLGHRKSGAINYIQWADCEMNRQIGALLNPGLSMRQISYVYPPITLMKTPILPLILTESSL